VAEQRKKVNKKRIAVFIFAALAVALLIMEATGFTQVVNSLLNPQMHFSTSATISYEAGSNPQLHPAQNGFFLATRTSMRFYSTAGAEVFRDSHLLANPTLFARGEFAALAEQDGGVVRVYNTSGLLHNIVVGGSVRSLSLSPTGYFSVITYHADRSLYEIRAFDNFGQEAVGGPHPYANIVPMLTDVCPNGRILAISYLDINDAQINSFINFVFVREADSLAHGLLDNIFSSSLSNPGQIIGAIGFMANGNLAAISDTRIFAINPANGQTLWEIPVNNRISSFYIGADWILVAFADGLLNRPAYALGTVVAYSPQGEELFRFQAQAHGAVDTIAPARNSVTIGVSGNFTALNRNGRELWQHTSPSNIADFAMLNADQIVVAGPTEAEILRRERQ